MEDCGTDQGDAVEPVHSRRQGQEGRTREEIARVRSKAQRRRLVIIRCRPVLAAFSPRKQGAAMARFIAAWLRACVAGSAVLLVTSAMAAVPPQTVRDLAFGESDAKITAIAALTASGDADALPLLQALLDGEVQTV